MENQPNQPYSQIKFIQEQSSQKKWFLRQVQAWWTDQKIQIPHAQGQVLRKASLSFL